MKCFQCVHWNAKDEHCGKLELKVRNRTIYTQGGYPWSCVYCQKPLSWYPNPLFGECPYMSGTSNAVENREDKELNHPKCPKATADLNHGQFCQCALVSRQVVEYPRKVETCPAHCGIAAFANTPEVVERTLSYAFSLSQLSCPKALIDLMISRGYQLTKAGWVRSGADEFTIRDLIRNLGDAEMKALEATPRTGKRLVESIRDFLYGFNIYLHGPMTSSDKWEYCGSDRLMKAIREIRKEAEAGK